VSDRRLTTAGSTTGLSSAEAARRLSRDGPNLLPKERHPAPWRLLLRQMTHFFAGMLWAAAGLAVLAGLPPLGAAIVVVILLNGTFAFLQEYRADRAAARLQSLLPTRAQVRRDDHIVTIEVVDLVVGDLAELTGGDRVGADMEISSAHLLAVDESMLTGESVPVRPDAGGELSAGTFVVEGTAEAVVTATGARTRLAGIADLSRSAHRPASPLAVELHRVVRAIAILAVGVGAALALAALGLGTTGTDAFLFGVGVTVALVPEGLLPTITLSLARAAERMADQHALVRRLEAVETLGATTFICTDKTGTLTRNEMSVVEVWTPSGSVTITGEGYAPTGAPHGSDRAIRDAREAAASAVRCIRGRTVERNGRWQPEGDPMEVAIDVLAHRLDALPPSGERIRLRIPFTPDRRRSTVVADEIGYVIGAPEVVVARCVQSEIRRRSDGALSDLTSRGLRAIAVARSIGPTKDGAEESDLELLGLIGLEDPPRDDVAEALKACRTAGIAVAMVTGDHVGTAEAVAREVGLLGSGGLVVEGRDLPADNEALASLLDRPDGVVVARVTPGDKLRIARALRLHGHVVAMTGDGVNDAPALREADVGVAMGRSGSDVAREAADLVLLDDHFATIVAAVELGRATFANIRRFLTYHLTDNVAELSPFAVWALSGGSVPLAIGVLQVLALDIGTDMLPAVALGTEPPDSQTMTGPARTRRLVDGRLLRRAFGVLGPVEAVLSMGAYLVVLTHGGWTLGETPSTSLLAAASGTTFAVIATCQMANAFACRSETRPAWSLDPRRNPLVIGAVAAESLLLLAFVGLPPMQSLLDGDWPTSLGWSLAFVAVPVFLAADAVHKRIRRNTEV